MVKHQTPDTSPLVVIYFSRNPNDATDDYAFKSASIEADILYKTWPEYLQPLPTRCLYVASRCECDSAQLSSSARDDAVRSLYTEFTCEPPKSIVNDTSHTLPERQSCTPLSLGTALSFPCF